MSNSQAGWRMAQQRPNAPGLPACDARNVVEKGNKRRTQRSGERRNEVGRSTAETDRAGSHRLCRSTKAGSLAWLSIDTPLLKTKEGFFGQALLALDSPRFASALLGARIAAEPQSVVSLMRRAFQASGYAGFYSRPVRKLQAYFFGSCVKLVMSGSCESTFFSVSGRSDHRMTA